MSLPSGGVWPPKPHDRVLEAVGQCQAWWEGDHGLLNEAAGQAPRNRPSQFRGGLVGAVGRMFWGKPTHLEQATRKLHVPIAADLVQMGANLLHADGLTVLISQADRDDDGEPSAADQAAQDRLDRIMNTQQFHSALLIAGESCAALGGVYARVVWDVTITENAWIDFVDADRAIPEFEWGRLVAVTFWTVLASPDERHVWRHLERYEPGKIVHGLYVGTDTELGRRVDLTAHTATENLVTDAEGAVQTGSDRLAAGYIPNARPNPVWRTDPILRHLGRSDLSPDVVELMDQLDEVWSSLARDVRLAKARIIVSEDLLNQGGPGQGTGFDTDREIYSPIGNPSGGDGGMASTIQFIQPEIRVEAHLAVATELILEILRRAGYSPISFGMDEGGSAATATEIEARSKASNQTITGKQKLWANVLGPLGRTLLEVDAVQFPATKVTVTEDLEIQWPPAVRDTELQKGRTLQALDGARAISTEEKVRRLNPDWDSGRIDAEVAAIRAEGGMDLPDLGGMAVPDFPARKGLPDADTVEDGLVEPDDD